MNSRNGWFLFPKKWFVANGLFLFTDWALYLSLPGILFSQISQSPYTWFQVCRCWLFWFLILCKCFQWEMHLEILAVPLAPPLLWGLQSPTCLSSRGRLHLGHEPPSIHPSFHTHAWKHRFRKEKKLKDIKVYFRLTQCPVFPKRVPGVCFKEEIFMEVRAVSAGGGSFQSVGKGFQQRLFREVEIFFLPF